MSSSSSSPDNGSQTTSSFLEIPASKLHIQLAIGVVLTVMASLWVLAVLIQRERDTMAFVVHNNDDDSDSDDSDAASRAKRRRRRRRRRLRKEQEAREAQKIEQELSEADAYSVASEHDLELESVHDDNSVCSASIGGGNDNASKAGASVANHPSQQQPRLFRPISLTTKLWLATQVGVLVVLNYLLLVYLPAGKLIATFTALAVWIVVLRTTIRNEVAYAAPRVDRLWILLSCFWMIACGLTLATFARLSLNEGSIYQGPARIVGYDYTSYNNADGETLRTDLEVTWGGSWGCPDSNDGLECIAQVSGALCETKYEPDDLMQASPDGYNYRELSSSTSSSSSSSSGTSSSSGSSSGITTTESGGSTTTNASGSSGASSSNSGTAGGSTSTTTSGTGSSTSGSSSGTSGSASGSSGASTTSGSGSSASNSGSASAGSTSASASGSGGSTGASGSSGGATSGSSGSSSSTSGASSGATSGGDSASSGTSASGGSSTSGSSSSSGSNNSAGTSTEKSSSTSSSGTTATTNSQQSEPQKSSSQSTTSEESEVEQELEQEEEKVAEDEQEIAEEEAENEELEQDNEELETEVEEEEEYEDELDEYIEDLLSYDDDYYSDDYWMTYDWDSVWGEYACEDLFDSDLAGQSFDGDTKPGDDGWPFIYIYGSCKSCNAYLMDYYSTQHFAEIKSYERHAMLYGIIAAACLVMTVLAASKRRRQSPQEKEIELLQSEGGVVA